MKMENSDGGNAILANDGISASSCDFSVQNCEYVLQTRHCADKNDVQAMRNIPSPVKVALKASTSTEIGLSQTCSLSPSPSPSPCLKKLSSIDSSIKLSAVELEEALEDDADEDDGDEWGEAEKSMPSSWIKRAPRVVVTLIGVLVEGEI